MKNKKVFFNKIRIIILISIILFFALLWGLYTIPKEEVYNFLEENVYIVLPAIAIFLLWFWYKAKNYKPPEDIEE